MTQNRLPTKHFTNGRGQKESTIVFSKINENPIQETRSEIYSFNAVAVSWQVAILEPFQARGYCHDSVNKATKNGGRQVRWILMYLMHLGRDPCKMDI